MRLWVGVTALYWRLVDKGGTNVRRHYRINLSNLLLSRKALSKRECLAIKHDQTLFGEQTLFLWNALFDHNFIWSCLIVFDEIWTMTNIGLNIAKHALIKSFDSVFGKAWQIPINWPLRDRKSKSDAIFTFQRAAWARTTAHKYFALANKGLTLEGLTTFMDCCLRTRDRNVVDYPESLVECHWEDDVLCWTPHVAMIIRYRLGFWIHQYLISERYILQKLS